MDRGLGPELRRQPYKKDTETEEDAGEDSQTKTALLGGDTKELKWRVHKLSNNPKRFFSKGRPGQCPRHGVGPLKTNK